MHFFTLVGITFVLWETAGAGAPFVTTRAGGLHGGICANTDKAVFFKSIPYARPPVGLLRFLPPQPYEQMYPGGSLNATTTAPSCIQFGSHQSTSAPTHEDCLYLDIWKPANASECERLPVRVWLYGGGDLAGSISDAEYDGCNVAAAGTILVSINYRVGPLGFISLESAGFRGNQGIQDALMGLKWVQDNINAFGGDPKRVVLQGQSAGAINAFSISTLPQAPKLISAGIYESGGGRFLTEQSAVEAISVQFAQHLDCIDSSGACLQTKPVTELQSAFLNVPLHNTYGDFKDFVIPNVTTPAFLPCVDGVVIPKQPDQQPALVPSIFGTNSQEGNAFALDAFPNPATATAANYTEFLHLNFGPDAALIEAHYPLKAFSMFPFPEFTAMATVFTHAEFFCPTRRGAQRTVAAGIPTWVYVFSHSSKCPWLPEIPPQEIHIYGAAHAAELPFVFGDTKQLPFPNGTCDMTEEEVKISEFMLSAWSSMAEIRRPTVSSMWPAWTNAQQSLGININNSVMPGYVNFTACELWDYLDRQPRRA